MSNNQFGEMFKMLGSQFKMPSFDASNMMDASRRNAEAVTAANQVMIEGIQAISRRQAEMTKSSFEQAMQTSKAIFSGKTPETNTAKQAELVQDAYGSAINNAKELSEMASKSSMEAFDVINQRATEAFSELNKAA